MADDDQPIDLYERIERLVGTALILVDLLYKVIAAAIALAVVAYAAEKTGSYTLYMMGIVLTIILCVYSLAIPIKTSILFHDHLTNESWKVRLGALLCLAMIVAVTVSIFNLLPEVIKYMNDAAHPALKEAAIQH